MAASPQPFTSATGPQMSARAAFFSICAIFVLAACSAAPPLEAAEISKNDDSALTVGGGGVIVGGGGIGPGGRIVDPGPHYCPTVDTACGLLDVQDTNYQFDEALEAAGCTPEKLYVGDPTTFIGPYTQRGSFSAFVSRCPHTGAVTNLVAEGLSFGVDAVFLDSVCDKCIPAATGTSVWVAWRFNIEPTGKHHRPNCGSGCKIPVWW